MNHLTFLALTAALASSGCKEDKSPSGEGATTGKVTSRSATTKASTIKIDGSSTVFPITQAVAEEYQIKHGGRVTVGVSGTGGGFKKFCRGETAISGASRPIKFSEVEMCTKAGIEFIELTMASQWS